MPAPSRSASPPSVLSKVDRILAAFDDDHQIIGLSDLARIADLAKPTVHRLASELVALGLLDRIDERFSLGRRLFELGQRVPGYRDITRLAIPFVEDLYVATGATVFLSVRDGNEILYVIKIRGHTGENEVSSLAGRLPLHCTATGRAILAAEPDATLEECIAAGLPRMTRHTVTSPSLLRQLVDEARLAGAASEREEVRLGYGAAAAAVLGSDGRPVAAIGIAMPIHKGEPSSYHSLVRTSARAIGRMLDSTST
ncbi:IclR family transcriptional regulator [Nitriliruptor alkaliphilus]|uniref:IclR family transcriptional regulator n=1 Tax=Nitriliruptor alkaliphilus TaxID=427918 RepID=UPI0006976D28|nr:IclR family transcriptional regulator [Nitriliruptor alkaliphilus]